jgi:hypothetical protein
MISTRENPFVELGDPGRERLHKRVQIGVRQGAINVAVGLGLVGSNGIAAVFSKTQWTQLFHWLETVLGSLPPTLDRVKALFAA